MENDILYSVIISEHAENNFDSIINYLIEEWNIQVKDDFLERFRQIITFLEINPFMYPEFSKKKHIRRCYVTKHNAMYYRIKKNTVEIITIYDTRKKPSSLKLK